MLLVLNVTCFVALLALLAHLLLERSRVRRFARHATRTACSPSEAARELARGIHTSVVRREDDPPFLHRSLASIGASPSAVMRHGGCCSGIGRLYILTLDSLNIAAAQMTLYHASGEAQHCLVEVVIGDSGQLIDPTYGVAFESADGRPLSLADVQAGKEPRLVSIRDGGLSGYPPNDYYRFDYSQTKTANWTRTWPRRSAYAVLRHVIDIDRVRVPAALEWPQVIVGGLVILGAIGIDGVARLL